MVDRLQTVSIFGNDQDRAKAFCTGKLVFRLHGDILLFPGAPTRWISVVPPKGQTGIFLYAMNKNRTHYRSVIGKAKAMTCSVSAMSETVEPCVTSASSWSLGPSSNPGALSARKRFGEATTYWWENRLLNATAARSIDISGPSFKQAG